MWCEGKLIDVRPPWHGPDFHPHDLAVSSLALSHQSSQDNLLCHSTDIVLCNELRPPEFPSKSPATTQSLDFENGLHSRRRRLNHRILLVIFCVSSTDILYHLFIHIIYVFKIAVNECDYLQNHLYHAIFM